MTVVKIAAIVIVAAILSLIVRQYKGEYSLVIQLSGILLVILVALSTISSLFEQITSVMTDSQIDSDFVNLIIKILGISVIIELSADICRDTGNSALASNVEFLGKIIILSMTFPMIKTLVTFISGLF
ncbi:MAG: hypothetical protein IJM97_01880 [Clostridia bacterium]|nr:hypothetical protein [Clostridia bacterium]MBQ6707681.1 hypothetical protein [Clostridia bacterium]